MTYPLAIIQARHNSTRLYEKVLMDVGRYPMYEQVRRRAMMAVDNVHVAWAIDWPELHENDVLTRFWNVAALYPEADPIIRLTADCPLLDWGIMRWVISQLEGNYIVSTGPQWDGLDVEVFTREALYRSRPQDSLDREHVTLYMKRELKSRIIPLGVQLQWSVNTREDLDFVRGVYAQCEYCEIGHPRRHRGELVIWDIHDVYGLHPNGAPEPMACEAYALLKTRMTRMI